MPRSLRSQPIYLRVIDFIRERILAKELLPGDRLPSEAELSLTFNTTRATVTRGLRELVFEGLIIREAGRGSFVAPSRVEAPFEPMQILSFEQQLGEGEGKIEYRLIDLARFPATSEVAAALKLPTGAEIVRIERLRIVREIPLSFVVRYLPMPIGDRLNIGDLDRFSIHRILAGLGMPVARTAGRISATSASKRLADMLQVKAGAPLLMRTYILSDAAGKSLVYGRSLFRQEFQITYSTSS